MNVSISPFQASATFVGGNETNLLFQFDFTLYSLYNGASIFIVATVGVDTEVRSPLLDLTISCKSSMVFGTCSVIF